MTPLTEIIALFPRCVRCGGSLELSGRGVQADDQRPNRASHCLCVDLQFRNSTTSAGTQRV